MNEQLDKICDDEELIHAATIAGMLKENIKSSYLNEQLRLLLILCVEIVYAQQYTEAQQMAISDLEEFLR